MSGDWRVYRPAIWLGMLGVALVLLISPPYIGGAVIGFAVGIALKITRGLRAPAPAPPAGRRRRRRRTR